MTSTQQIIDWSTAHLPLGEEFILRVASINSFVAEQRAQELEDAADDIREQLDISPSKAQTGRMVYAIGYLEARANDLRSLYEDD